MSLSCGCIFEEARAVCQSGTSKGKDMLNQAEWSRWSNGSETNIQVFKASYLKSEHSTNKHPM